MLVWLVSTLTPSWLPFWEVLEYFCNGFYNGIVKPLSALADLWILSKASCLRRRLADYVADSSQGVYEPSVNMSSTKV